VTDTPIAHVTDTAFWVATYRANESARPDALFRDPLAASRRRARPTTVGGSFRVANEKTGASSVSAAELRAQLSGAGALEAGQSSVAALLPSVSGIATVHALRCRGVWLE